MKIYLLAVLSLLITGSLKAATAELSQNLTEEIKSSVEVEKKDIFIEASFQNSGGLVTGATIGWEAFKYLHIASRVYIPISVTNEEGTQSIELLGRIPFLNKSKGSLYVEGFLGAGIYKEASVGTLRSFRLQL